MASSNEWKDDNSTEEKDLSSILVDMYHDECDGVKEYANLSKELKQKYPDKGYSHIIGDMAMEEKVHRNHIKEIMLDLGYTFDDKLANAEKESDEALSHLFH